MEACLYIFTGCTMIEVCALVYKEKIDYLVRTWNLKWNLFLGTYLFIYFIVSLSRSYFVDRLLLLNSLEDLRNKRREIDTNETDTKRLIEKYFPVLGGSVVVQQTTCGTMIALSVYPV